MVHSVTLPGVDKRINISTDKTNFSAAILFVYLPEGFILPQTRSKMAFSALYGLYYIAAASAKFAEA